MIHLLIASLVWGFSFGLIGHVLVTRGANPYLITWVRLALSFLLFLPFLRPRAIPAGLAARLMALGVVQYGLMYLAYIHSFRYLPSHQVALFTILTPIFVTLIRDLARRRLSFVFLLAAGMAVAGAAVVRCDLADWKATLTGFLLVQASNLCFAAGQLAYGPLMERTPPSEPAPAGRGWTRDASVFAWLYLGGVLTVSIPALIALGPADLALDTRQWAALVYLGLVPSGLCFFLWNLGSRRANAGTLAVMNNAKIPLAVACSFLIFRESVNLPRLLIGGALFTLAVCLTERQAAGRDASRPHPAPPSGS